MKKFLIVIAVLGIATALPFVPIGMEKGNAEKNMNLGEIFPELKGRSLAGAEVSIPANTMGKPTILGLAFSPKAEQDLKGWMQPLYDSFLAKHGGVFEAGYFDGHIYLAALLSGAASLAGKGLEEKAAKGTDAELRPHVLLSKQDAAPILKAVNASDKTKPYFIVLDSKGVVKSIVSGAYTEAKMDELTEKAEEAE